MRSRVKLVALENSKMNQGRGFSYLNRPYIPVPAIHVNRPRPKLQQNVLPHLKLPLKLPIRTHQVVEVQEPRFLSLPLLPVWVLF